LSGEENRDLKNYSSKFESVDPPLPSLPLRAIVKRIKARGKVTILQQPAEGNQFTLIIEINDNQFGGPADYTIEINY